MRKNFPNSNTQAAVIIRLPQATLEISEGASNETIQAVLLALQSLIETAKANGLNVFAYLNHLLLYMPDTDWQNHPEELDDLMPWSPEVQKQCK